MPAGGGPSSSFGTRSLRKPVEGNDYRRRAVLAVCYAARDRGVREIRELLEIVGLDPREGLTCDVHGPECYAVGCGSDETHGGKSDVD